MLDNFSVENTRKAVEIIDGRFETESSGGITFETLRQYAECGVDYISVGALTHSVKSLDLSLQSFIASPLLVLRALVTLVLVIVIIVCRLCSLLF